MFAQVCISKFEYLQNAKQSKASEIPLKRQHQIRSHTRREMVRLCRQVASSCGVKLKMLHSYVSTCHLPNGRQLAAGYGGLGFKCVICIKPHILHSEYFGAMLHEITVNFFSPQLPRAHNGIRCGYSCVCLHTHTHIHFK